MDMTGVVLLVAVICGFAAVIMVLNQKLGGLKNDQATQLLKTETPNDITGMSMVYEATPR